MLRKKHLPFVLTPFLIVILIILFFWHQIGIFYRIFVLENSLKDVNLSLQITGKRYEMRNGKPVGNFSTQGMLKILNLAAFYQWNREDPLFYSPDLNIDNLKIAVDKIDKDQTELLNIEKRREHVYPTDFLKNFITSSQLMREFLKNPSLESSNALVSQQKNTEDLYKKESDDLLSFIEKNGPGKNFTAIELNVQKSISAVSSDLSKISSNSDILLSEITKRENCLNGTGDCQRPALNFEKPTVTKLVQPQLKEKLLDSKLIFSPLSTTFDYSKVKGPYVSKTPCFGWGDNFSYPDHFFYLEEGPQTNIQLATDIYFRKLSPESPMMVERALIAQGINYVLAASSKLYACPYNENLAEISEMHLFLESNKPILSSLNLSGVSNKDIFNTARNIEEEFFNSKYPSYENAQILSQYYGYLYRLIIQNKTLSDNSLSIKDELLRRKLVLSLKLGDFDKLLSYADDIINGTDQLALIYKGFGNVFVEKALYPHRNFYGVLYMPFSPSVFRNGRLSYYDKVKVKNAVSLGGSFMSYTQALGKYTWNVILSWFESVPVFENALKK